MEILHSHHKIPRHAGGTDDPDNLVELTPEEHAEAHRLLWEQYGRRYDWIAWKALSGQISQIEANILATKEANTGRPAWNKGKKGVQPSTRKGKSRSEKEKARISEGTKEGMKKTTKKLGRPKGGVPWNKGKQIGPHSEERKAKISASVLRAKNAP